MTCTAPAGLGTEGKKLWRGIAADDKYELRADEVRVLEDAAREADLIAAMESARKRPGFKLIVRGSQGQDVINPLISELRQHRATLAALLRQLKLPDESDTPEARSTSARAAANARWSRRGA